MEKGIDTCFVDVIGAAKIGDVFYGKKRVCSVWAMKTGPIRVGEIEM
jgi:hypothetical protein